MNAVDTNILIYAYDDQQPAKQTRAIALMDQLIADPQSSVLLWQVACEFIAVLRRWQDQSRLTAAHVDAYCQEILRYFPLSCPARSVIGRSFQLTAKYSLSHWDSLLVAAAIEAGVTTLFTKNLQAGARYESVTVVNPVV